MWVIPKTFSSTKRTVLHFFPPKIESAKKEHSKLRGENSFETKIKLFFFFLPKIPSALFFFFFFYSLKI